VHDQVLEQARAVADPVGAAGLQRLPDGFRAERLAGVNGNIEVFVADVLERFLVPFGRVSRFVAGDVEAYDAAIPVGYGQFRGFQGKRRSHVAHGA